MPQKPSSLSEMLASYEYPVMDFSKAVFIDLKGFSSMDEVYSMPEQMLDKIKSDPEKIKPDKTEKISKSLPEKDDHGKHPGRLLAYVVNNDSNTVSVVDILSLKKLTDITVGGGPFDLDISPSKRYIYVSNGKDDTLSVIRTFDNQVVDTIKLNTGTFTADDPSGVRVNLDGRYVYVANFLSKNMSVVDAIERRVIATIPLPFNPLIIDITKDGLFAYVTLSDEKTAAVVDLSTNLFLKTVPVGTDPEDVRISPTRPLAFVANFGSDNITAINTKIAESSPNTIPAGDGVFGLAFSPDGRTLYATNSNADTITVIDVFTHTPLFNIPVGNDNEPWGIEVTPDGRFMVVANHNADTISIISTKTNQIIGTVPVGKKPQYITILDTCMNY